MTNRRRFLAISAAAVAFPRLSTANPLYVWQGIALGARATLRLAHPDGKAISQRVAAEISRLEDVFSLYRPKSALMRLNQNGVLQAPPFELLECLSLADRVHQATAGRFDPTIQPLWACYAAHHAEGRTPAPTALRTARALVDWESVAFNATSISLRPDMALTLNGIAQGYIADRIAELLTREGLDNILINTGEFRAVGSHPQGGAWPVKLASGVEVPLETRALATSASRGTTFDQGATVGHILDPRTGLNAPTVWRDVTISAKSAALADALSTSACLFTTPAEIGACLAQFHDARLEAAIAA